MDGKASYLGGSLQRVSGRPVLEQLKHGGKGDALPLVVALKRQVGAGQLPALGSNGHEGIGVLVEDDVVAINVASEHAVVIAHHVGGYGAVDEVSVVLKVVLQDVVDHTHGQIAVGGGLDADELLCKTSGAVEDEADVDDLRTVFAGANKVLGAAHLVFDGVAAPNVDQVGINDDLRVDEDVVGGGAYVVELGIERAIVQTDGLHRVRNAECVAEALGHERLHAVGRRNAGAQVPHGNGFCAVFVAQLAQLRADFVKRLIPGDLLPLAFAALADALQRLLKALGIVGLAAGQASLLANVAVDCLGARVVNGFHADDLAIFYDCLQRAVVVVTPAGTRGVDERLAFFEHGIPPFASLPISLRCRWAGSIGSWRWS